MFVLLPVEGRCFKRLLHYVDYTIVDYRTLENGDGVIRVEIQYKNQEEKCEIYGELNVITGEFTLGNEGIQYSYFEHMFFVSEFVLGLSKDFKTLGDFMEENRFTLLMRFEASYDLLDAMRNKQYKEAARLLTYNFYGSPVSGELAETYHRYARNIDKYIKDIRGLFGSMTRYFEKYKVVSNDTQYIYRNQLTNFFKYMLINFDTHLLKPTADEINQFIEENREKKSPKHVNNTVKLVVDFLKSMYKLEVEGDIQLLDVPKRIKLGYSSGEICDGEEDFLYKVAKHRYFMDKLSFLYGTTKPFISVSKLRDKLRNFLFYRLSLETMSKSSMLINLRFSDFKNGKVHINGRKVPISKTTMVLVEEYKDFRSEWDDFIIIEKFWFANMHQRLVGRTDENEFLRHMTQLEREQLKRFKEIIESLTDEYQKSRSVSLKKEISKAKTDLNRFFTPIQFRIEKELKVSNKDLEDYLFISNWTEVIKPRTMNKVLQDVELKSEELRISRAKFLTQSGADKEVVDFLMGKRNDLIIEKECAAETEFPYIYQQGTRAIEFKNEYFNAEFPYEYNNSVLEDKFKLRLINDLVEYLLEKEVPSLEAEAEEEIVSKRNEPNSPSRKLNDKEKIEYEALLELLKEEKRQELLPNVEAEVNNGFEFKRSDIFNVDYKKEILTEQLFDSEETNYILEKYKKKSVKQG